MTNLIPADLAVAIALLSPDLSEEAFEREVKRLIRRHVPRRDRPNRSPVVEMFSTEIGDMIRDVVLEN